MYRLLFRKVGTREWNEGSVFDDDALTAEAREMLADRYARDGLEVSFEQVIETEAEEV